MWWTVVSFIELPWMAQLIRIVMAFNLSVLSSWRRRLIKREVLNKSQESQCLLTWCHDRRVGSLKSDWKWFDQLVLDSKWHNRRDKLICLPLMLSACYRCRLTCGWKVKATETRANLFQFDSWLSIFHSTWDELFPCPLSKQSTRSISPTSTAKLNNLLFVLRFSASQHIVDSFVRCPFLCSSRRKAISMFQLVSHLSAKVFHPDNWLLTF